MKKPGIALAIVIYIVSSDISAATINPIKNIDMSDSVQLEYASDAYATSGDWLTFHPSMSQTSTGIDEQQQETSVPLPAAAWLFLSGIAGMIGVSRRRRKPEL